MYCSQGGQQEKDWETQKEVTDKRCEKKHAYEIRRGVSACASAIAFAFP